MSQFFSQLFEVAVGALFFLWAIFATVRESIKYIKKNWVFGSIIALMGCIMVIGIGGFEAQWLQSSGDLNLPDSFQWPAGNVEGIANLGDGTHVVPMVDQARIQLYDANWHFLRGWNVYTHTYGKSFVVEALPGGSIKMLTGDLYTYVFSADGQVLREEHSHVPGDKIGEIIYPHGESIEVPTPLFLLVFSNPFYCWGISLLGGIGITSIRQLFPADT